MLVLKCCFLFIQRFSSSYAFPSHSDLLCLHCSVWPECSSSIHNVSGIVVYPGNLWVKLQGWGEQTIIVEKEMKENKKEKSRNKKYRQKEWFSLYFKNILLSIRYTISELAKIIQSSGDLLKISMKNFKSIFSILFLSLKISMLITHFYYTIFTASYIQLYHMHTFLPFSCKNVSSISSSFTNVVWYFSSSLCPILRY